MARHSDELKSRFQSKVTASEKQHKDVKSKLEEQLKNKNAQLEKTISQLKSAGAQSSTLKDENDALRSKLNSDNIVKQALQKKIDELQKEVAEIVAKQSARESALQQDQKRLEEEKVSLTEKIRSVSDERDGVKNTVEELRGKLDALEHNLNMMIDEKKESDQKLHQAARNEVKMGSTEKELSALREQVTKLKLQQTKSSSLLEKLQAEKEASERKHGQRTALVGMLEAQLAELNDKNTEANAKLEAALYDLSQRDETIAMTKEQLEKTEKTLASTQLARKQASDSITSAQKGADAKKSKIIETLQREVQNLQIQMGRKSAAAQRLIQERESECIELRKANKVLQQEVDKGSLSDRRIFELAAQQSNRESVASAEIELRDKLVAKLSHKLEARDGDLASAEYNARKVEGQVEELCRVRRREDVNLDYLKSIVVQYLSKPPGSSEREALLPVLATLLQFDSNDYKIIEDGKNKLSWWGNVAPVMITPPTPNALASEEATSLLGRPNLSAEVSVSAPSDMNGNGRPRTSLQF
uniref:GRIP domain-containing protein n=1 Tax=Cyclophora tenuis TaxID=216820 RepID=A0A7S1CYD3_CYCTE